MLNQEPPTGPPQAEPDDADVFGLVSSLLGYLQEIDGYRAVCRRHEGTAVIEESDGTVRIVRRFRHDEQLLTRLREEVTSLENSGASGPRRPKRGRQEPQSHPPEAGSDSLTGRSLVWEARPLVLHVTDNTPPGVLTVALQVLPWESALPELPLRAVASVLRCHELVVPEVYASPLPTDPGDEGHGIREYLLRAMPANLYASKCI